MTYFSFSTIINIEANTNTPPRVACRVKCSPPNMTAKIAAKTTSMVRMTATFVVVIFACDQVCTAKAIAVHATDVKIITAHTPESGGGE
jgi:hypothetical protein